jgi:chromosomal replication initiator protein
VHEGLRDVRPPPRPSTVWTLDALVSGEANKVAMGAAQSVIAAPGTDYNPLVLVGPSGSGKTHLLHGIGNAIMRESETAVACLSAQQFFDELLEAIDADKVEAWRRRYRGVSALLIDDLHLLAGKERSQEELFHLLNAMFDAERQVVVTLPALPGDLEALEERIVSRLEGGLVVQLGVPDPAMRRLLVERAFAGLGRAPNPELTAYLAEAPGIGESVRQVLEGVERVVGAAATRGVEPSVDLGRELLERFVPIRPRPSVGLRTSGVLSSPFLTVRSREKVVWDWPDTPARIIEELA